MRPPTRLLLALLLVPLASAALFADTILFDDHIDAQQKTELRFDVPDGCVITGLGFRAAYDNITTMHCRYHRLAPDGTLTDPAEVHLGSEPNHACEAKVLLPDGWVAVGFGAAGEPEWDVTLLRIWARPLRPDGTLGQIKAYSHGFKPDRDPEIEFTLAESDRIMTGAGLRFHQNDIAGLYVRSKRILNLTDQARKRLRSLNASAWILDGFDPVNLKSLQSDIYKYAINRIILRLPATEEGLPDDKQLNLLSKLFDAAPKVKIYFELRTAGTKSVLRLFKAAPELAGIVIDLPSLSSKAQTKNVILNLQDACSKAGKDLYFRFTPRINPRLRRVSKFIKTLPGDVGLILPFESLEAVRKKSTRYSLSQLGSRDIIIELSLTKYPAASALLPDVRINEIPGRLVESALAGADSFIVPVNVAGRYLPQTVNAPTLDALHALAKDPLQSTDALWDKLCTELYGRSAQKTASALKRTPAINDLIYRTLGYPVIWDNGVILPIEAIDARIESLVNTSPQTDPTLAELLAPTDKTIQRASGEKQTALWLLQQSIPDANEAFKIMPSPEHHALLESMRKLRSTTLLCHDATQAYLLSKIYAIDGAPATCTAIEAALERLRDPQQYPVKFDVTADFAASVEKSLNKSKKDALLVKSLARVRDLADDDRHESAAVALLGTFNSQKFAPHIDKQNIMIGQIASSLRAFGDISPNIAVLRHGDGRWGIEKVAGRWSWAIGLDRPCLYLDYLSGPLEPPGDYLLSFEYYDKGDWKLHFHYDSDYPPDQKRDYHPAEPLQLTNTKTWKKGSFLLTNCLFSSSQNAQSDMRFVTGSGAHIRNIRLKPK